MFCKEKTFECKENINELKIADLFLIESVHEQTNEHYSHALAKGWFKHILFHKVYMGTNIML